MNAHSKMAITWLLLAACAPLCARCDDSDILTIRLRPVVETRHAKVRLSDVAEVSFSQHQRELEDLDLLAIPEGDKLALLDKSRIDIRLQLFGLERDEYQLLGPDQILISLQSKSRDPRFSLLSATSPAATVKPAVYTEPISDLLVEQSIQSTLEQQFGLSAGHVRSQLLRSFVDRQLQQEVPAESFRLEVIAPAEFPYGRSNLTVRIWDGKRLVRSLTAYVDVRRRQNVLVARKTIVRTMTVKEDSVTAEMRFVDSRRDELQPGDIVGKSAQRTVLAGEILSMKDFGERHGGLTQQVVQVRDSVRLVAYRKGMKFVIPSAEALQSGRVGQLIRVRNLQSNKTVTGRVVARGEVEIPLQ